MGAFQKRLREFFQKLRDPWTGDYSDRNSDEIGAQIAYAVHALWLLCVPIVVWMALGDPPWWLMGPVMAILWTLGIFFFLVIGLPPLAVPFALIWYAFPRNRKKGDDPEDEIEEEFKDEWELLYEERAKKAEELKESDALPPDYELLPKDPDDRKSYFDRLSNTASYLPPLPMWTGGVILIVALFVSGRPILASVYAIPVLGWLALEGLGWLMQRWRRA